MWGNVGESVYFYINISIDRYQMIQLIGEYECKLDAKGRMVVPASLKRQLPAAEKDGLVVNRGFEKNLVIYTKEEWSKKMLQLSRSEERRVGKECRSRGRQEH